VINSADIAIVQRGNPGPRVHKRGADLTKPITIFNRRSRTKKRRPPNGCERLYRDQQRNCFRIDGCVFIGDVNEDGNVTGSDVNLCKAQVGVAVSSSNFRSDINAIAKITGSEVSLIKTQVGTMPPP
jgi:hypothetical protein